MTKLGIGTIVIITLSIISLILGVYLLTQLSEFTSLLPENQGRTPAINVQVSPSSSQIGTLFFIKAVSPANPEAQDLTVELRNEKRTYFLDLYDDGQNYDGEANDGTYGAHFNSENAEYGTYEVINNEEVISTFEVVDPNCEFITGSKTGKIDFLFLPSGYTDYEDFKEDIKDLVTGRNSLTDLDPFNKYPNDFSFNALNTSKLNCKIGCDGVPTAVCCNDKLVYEEASLCEYDSIVVLVNSDERCGSASTYTKVCAKNPGSNLFLTHEMGHSFADLDDEYVYPSTYGSGLVAKKSINCDTEGCSKWNGITQGCFAGCTDSNLYRSSKRSIMNDLYPEFNIVSTTHLVNLIDNIIKETENSRKSYFFSARYLNEDVKIKNAITKPLPSIKDFRDSSYQAVIKDENDIEIYTTNIKVPIKSYPLPNASRNLILSNDFEFLFSLPYFRNADSVEVVYQNVILDKKPLSIFADNCGDNFCNPSENHMTCPFDCSVEEDNFCQSNLCDPDCKDQSGCSFSKTSSIYISYFLLLMTALLILTLVLKIKKNKDNLINNNSLNHR